MIPRYSNPEMETIWSTDFKYKTWLHIEILACEAQEKLGRIPVNTTKNIKKLAKFNTSRILEIEKETKHDVIAFLTNVAEYVGEDAKYIHKGLTSSDILDTCFSIQLVEASNLIINKLKLLLSSLKKKALETKNITTIGRSHGIHAEPTTMGLKFAYAYAEFNRCLSRMLLAKKEISVCKISGPVGNYSSISPEVEEYLAKKLDLKPDTISTQIIPRDRHASFFSTIALVASCIDRMATEIRHLQRSEVLEVEESFSKGQKGSSAMPHKRNPVLSENLSGLSRYLRSICNPAMENIVLWHERDISHSSVERVIGPDATIALDFSLKRLNDIIKNLIIYPKNINKNLNKLKGLYFSQNVMLKLIDKGITREEAYAIVQKSAMKTWKNLELKKSNSFKKNLQDSKEIKEYLTKKDIQKIFSETDHTKYINYVFKKVFK